MKKAAFIISAQAENKVYRFDKNGVMCLVLPGTDMLKCRNKKKNSSGLFSCPGGLLLDESGLLFVADRNNGEVKVFCLPGDAITASAAPRKIFELEQLAPGAQDFKLRQVYCYPNPYRSNSGAPGQFICAEVGIADSLEIKIFNIAGELVQAGTISGGDYQVSGGEYSYEFPVNVKGLASGIYLYRVRVVKAGYPAFTVIEKLAIIR
ncbi:MAG: hypothetical protein LHV68_01680 [Elusimicrobia bacterium]|nr:hypothetical protein [Candidatus Liberimonas magnetica]